MKQVNNNMVNEIVELNEEMLEQVNGGVLLEAAAVGTVVLGSALVAGYVYHIVKLCQFRKVWAEEKKQRRAQKAAEAKAAA